MPSSTWHNIETFVEIIRELRPSSFLDVGVGNGKWGFLVREYSDVWEGHFLRAQWNCNIEGVEIYEPYVTENTHQRAIYDKIHIGDITRVVNSLDSFDVIYAGDVLEHIEKEASVNLIRQLTAMAKMAVICSIPLGHEWLGRRGYDNGYEDHVSSWEIEELQGLGFTHYRVTHDPADKTRRIGFFVYARRELTIAGLKPLNRGWFDRIFGYKHR
jgi:Methyltransferase domain